MHGKIKDTNRMMYQTGVSSMKMDYRQICKNEEISLLIEKEMKSCTNWDIQNIPGNML